MMRALMWAPSMAAYAIVASLAVPVYVHAQPIRYDIRPGGLAQVLDKWARRSKKQVLYRIDDVQGASSPGVRGTLSAISALDVLLTGTGFVAKADQSTAIAIIPQYREPDLPVSSSVDKAGHAKPVFGAQKP